MAPPKRSNTAPATAARLAKARERKLTAMAEELRAAGYKVSAPGTLRTADGQPRCSDSCGRPLGHEPPCDPSYVDESRKKVR